MKHIIIEDMIYKVSEREFKVIEKMRDELKGLASLNNFKLYNAKEHEVSEYLAAAKILYKKVGYVAFHYAF